MKTNMFDSFEEAMTRDVGHMETLMSSDGLSFLLIFFPLLCVIALVVALVFGYTWKERGKYFLVGVALSAGVSFLFAVPLANVLPVEKDQSEHIVQHLEENYHIQNIEFLEDQYDYPAHITVAFQHNDGLHRYESRFTYNEEHNVMLPVITEGEDMIPVQDGSDVDAVLESTKNVLTE